LYKYRFFIYCFSKFFLLLAGGDNFTCLNINYFPKTKYEQDPYDSTNAIPCEYSCWENMRQRWNPYSELNFQKCAVPW
jgi:hypothetical protein